MDTSTMKSSTKGSRDLHQASKSYLRQIYPGEEADSKTGIAPEVDIIAVHGLDLLNNEEHGISTWSQDGIIWLNNFLPHQRRVKRLRVLVFGYNSSAVFGASTTGINGAADNLINQLFLARKECPGRPIVFVCHSLGGILVKRAIVSAYTSDYYRSIYDSTKGVAFFATPHNGGHFATFGDVLVRICGAVTGNARNDIMEALRRDSNIAGGINRDFARRAQGLRVLNFIETKPMSKPFLGIVVDRNSASLNWPEPAEIQVLMEATHRTICKYSVEDELYERVSENLVDLINWAVEASSEDSATAAPISNFATPDLDNNLALHPYEERSISDDSLSWQSTASTISCPINSGEISDKGSYLFPSSPPSRTLVNGITQRYFEEETRLAGTPAPTWPVHMLPHIPPLNAKLIPRDNLFKSMTATLENSGTFAIYGLGGAGKSNLAARLAYWKVTHNPQISVFWIHGGAAESVSEGFKLIAQKLQIGLSVREEQERFRMMRDWLEDKKHGGWIMIIDGADDAAIFKRYENSARDRHGQSSTKNQTFMEYIPRCNHGQIVFTTKAHSAATMYATQGAVLQVGTLSLSEALQMLRNGLDDNLLLDAPKAAELVMALHCLPLAIAQATEFMNRNNLTVSKYLERIRDSSTFADLMTRPLPSSSNAVYTTWNISYQRIQSGRQLAADVLAIMSFLEEETIPISLLGNIFGDTLDLIEAIGDLKDYSLISPGSELETLNIHRLVQVTTQRWLRESRTLNEWATKTLSAIADHFPDASNQSSQSRCALYLPHALKLLQNPNFDQENNLTFATLQHKIGVYYHTISQWSEASRWTTAAYAIRKSNLGPSDPSTLEVQEQQIHILRHLGDFANAAKEAQSLKHNLKSLHGRSHPSTLAAYRLISDILQDQGLFSLSLTAAMKSYNGFRSLYASSEPDNSDLLLSTARLGSIYTHLGELGKADELDLNLLTSFKRSNDGDSKNSLKVLFRISHVQRALGKYEESEETARTCYERQKLCLGERHVDTLKSYFNIGLSLQAQGRFEASIKAFEDVVRWCKELVGEKHVYTSISTFHFAQSLAGVRRLREARSKFEEAMNGFQDMDPRKELEVARCKEGIATVVRYGGELEEAEGLYEQVLKTGKGQKGKEREILASLCWEGLAETWKLRAAELQGKEKKTNLKKALKFGQQALEGRKKVYGPQHPETKRAAELVLGILERLGDEGKVVRRLRSEYGVDGYQTLDDAKRETETGDLISSK